MNFMMSVFTKKKNNYYGAFSNYSAGFTVYLVTVMVAATFILPLEEHIVAGLIKAAIWPLYLLAYVLHLV
jgi:hypothetical protein